MGKLEKYLDKEKLANASGDCEIIEILENTIKEQSFKSNDIENYDKIVDTIELLYKLNNLMFMAETTSEIASKYYTEIEDLYYKIKMESCELIGYEDVWSYGEN